MKRAVPRRRAIAAILFASALVVAAGAPAAAQTLTEAIRAALRNNPDVGVVAADREAVEQELRQARAQYMPSLDFRGIAGPEYNDGPTFDADDDFGDDAGGDETLFRAEAQLTLSQLLFDGFGTRSEVERQLARLDSAAYRVAEAAEFVALDVVEAYLDVLRNRTLVELAEENIESHQSILGRVQQLVRQGAGNIADARQAEARLAAARATLAEAQQNLRDAIAAYTRLVGVPPEDLLAPEPPVTAVPEQVEAAMLLAAAANPTVQIAEADIAVAEAELRAAKSGYYPSLSAELGATAGHNVQGVEDRNLAASALLVMRYNLFRGGADVAREREAFARVREARRQLDLARRRAEEEAAVSYSALIAARERLAALADQVEANARSRDAYADQFLLGQRSLLDLLDVENELFLSRSSLATAEATEDFGIYRLLTVTGRLLDELRIDRPPEAVDIYRTAPEPLQEDAIGPQGAAAPSRPLTTAAAPIPVPVLRPASANGLTNGHNDVGAAAVGLVRTGTGADVAPPVPLTDRVVRPAAGAGGDGG